MDGQHGLFVKRRRRRPPGQEIQDVTHPSMLSKFSHLYTTTELLECQWKLKVLVFLGVIVLPGECPMPLLELLRHQIMETAGG